MDKKNKTLSLIIGVFLSFFFFFIVIKRVISKNTNKNKVKKDTIKKAEIADRAYSKKKLRNLENTKKNTNNSEPKESAKSNLTERESKIMNLFDDQDEIDMDLIKDTLKGVHVRTIRRDLAKLADKQLIKKIGKTKGSKYKLV